MCVCVFCFLLLLVVTLQLAVGVLNRHANNELKYCCYCRTYVATL
jgi:hypothetical protein